MFKLRSGNKPNFKNIGSSPAKHGTTDDFLYGRNGHNPDTMSSFHEDWHTRKMEEEKKEPSPNKQKVPKPKKSTESAHGQLDDAQAEYEEDMRLYNESKKDGYWYKINGKKVNKNQYLEYKNKPGSDEKGKQTNDPDVYGRKCGGSPSNPKVCK